MASGGPHFVNSYLIYGGVPNFSLRLPMQNKTPPHKGPHKGGPCVEFFFNSALVCTLVWGRKSHYPCVDPCVWEDSPTPPRPGIFFCVWSLCAPLCGQYKNVWAPKSLNGVHFKFLVWLLVWVVIFEDDRPHKGLPCGGFVLHQHASTQGIEFWRTAIYIYIYP